MLAKKPQYPSWLLILSITQAATLLVFMNFAGTLPLIQAEWELSNTQAGAIQAASQFGYALAALIFSSLTDYVSAKKLVVGGALWAGVSNLLFAGLAHDAFTGIAFRSLTGLGIAGIYMPGLNFISQRTPPERRGRAVGLFVASFTVGSAASLALSGFLAASSGWRFAVGLMSIGPLMGAVASWRHLPGASTDQNQPQVHNPWEQTPRPQFRIFRDRATVLATISYAAHAWEVLGLRSWLTAFLVAALSFTGYGLAEATRVGATLSGMATLTGAVSTALVAAISDRFGRTPVIMVVMGASFFCVLWLGLSFSSSLALLAIITLGASFLTNADSAVISTTITEAVPANYLGRVLAIYAFSGFTAGTIAPLAFGVVLDFALHDGVPTIGSWLSPWSWAFATLALGSVVGLLAVIPLHRLLRNRQEPVFPQPRNSRVVS